MGPITLFDKSFLQSLSVDESVWFDYFFLAIVAPFFFIETLADLSKNNKGDRSPEREVQIIADKFPDNGRPCLHHADAVFANLSGQSIPMNGTVPLPGGRPIKAAGRTALTETPIDAIWGAMKEAGIGGESSKALVEARDVAVAAVHNPEKTIHMLALLLLFLGISMRDREGILDSWRRSGSPPLHEYAPYAAYVLTVEIFFQVALAAGLIARHRPSNRVDIAYLFYLPFCYIFLSSDKLHGRCAPLFLRSDQEFVEGASMKADLRAVNAYFLEERADDKERDIWSFPRIPPANVAPLMSRLWIKYMGERDDERHTKMVTEDHQKVIRELNEMSVAPGIPLDQVDFDVTNPDAIIFTRRVRRRKGSWLQIPKDVK